jgi:hypothetical protein
MKNEIKNGNKSLFVTARGNNWDKPGKSLGKVGETRYKVVLDGIKWEKLHKWVKVWFMWDKAG